MFSQGNHGNFHYQSLDSRLRFSKLNAYQFKAKIRTNNSQSIVRTKLLETVQLLPYLLLEKIKKRNLASY